MSAGRAEGNPSMVPRATMVSRANALLMDANLLAVLL